MEPSKINGHAFTLAARVSPASDFEDAVAFVERIVARIGIGLQMAFECLQHRLRVLCLAVRREGIPDGGLSWSSMSAIIDSVDP
jgi:hypothetical protein